MNAGLDTACGSAAAGRGNLRRSSCRRCSDRGAFGLDPLLMTSMGMVRPMSIKGPDTMARMGREMFIATLLLAGLGWAWGCSPERPQGVLAPGSTVAFTNSQAKMARSILVGSAQGVTDTGPPMELLPPKGWRWTDLRRAIAQAGLTDGVEVAILRFDQSDTHATAILHTVEGWPATLHARRDGGQVMLEAYIGPYPGRAHARSRGQLLISTVHQQLLKMGRQPRLAPYRATQE